MNPKFKHLPTCSQQKQSCWINPSKLQANVSFFSTEYPGMLIKTSDCVWTFRGPQNLLFFFSEIWDIPRNVRHEKTVLLSMSHPGWLKTGSFFHGLSIIIINYIPANNQRPFFRILDVPIPKYLSSYNHGSAKNGGSVSNRIVYLSRGEPNQPTEPWLIMVFVTKTGQQKPNKTGWWFQPLWKILIKMGIFPK